ncbi:hypothetical protein [Streptomyces lanatus]|uniref:Uncharacterized protein n=1 Tax=Streptomyces lanatus TaxID=66900 RepID=A0ABV1XIU7_9ACTN|nr:hypothetical protein [Streptomyces lanatus]GHG92011.1 hypothetical protein GCM10018780_13180 [Streptomyces lanatus]
MTTCPTVDHSSPSEEPEGGCAQRLTALENRVGELERRQRRDRIVQWVRAGVTSVFHGLWP